MRQILLLIIIVLVSSCEYIENLTATSEITTQEYYQETIKYIVANCSCIIEMSPEESDTVYVEGYEHVLEGLQISFSNDSLIINHEDKEYIQESTRPTITIYANNLQKVTALYPIELNTIDTISTDSFFVIIYPDASLSEINMSMDCSSLKVHTYGSEIIGNYYFEGSATTVWYYIEGCVTVDAYSLESENVTVTHKSVGDCQINCEETLDVTTYYSGNTLYMGDPVVEESYVESEYFSCTGEVINVD